MLKSFCYFLCKITWLQKHYCWIIICKILFVLQNRPLIYQPYIFHLFLGGNDSWLIIVWPMFLQYNIMKNVNYFNIILYKPFGVGTIGDQNAKKKNVKSLHIYFVQRTDDICNCSIIWQEHFNFKYGFVNYILPTTWTLKYFRQTLKLNVISYFKRRTIRLFRAGIFISSCLGTQDPKTAMNNFKFREIILNM